MESNSEPSYEHQWTQWKTFRLRGRGAMSPHFSDITKQTPVHQEKVSSADNSVNTELEDIKQNGR